VDDSRDLRVLGENPVDEHAIFDIAAVEREASGEFGAAGDEVIQDHRGVTGVRAGVSDRAADVTRTASYQDFHP
jgi:hypothetical protein